jgi:hypothetical protein
MEKRIGYNLLLKLACEVNLDATRGLDVGRSQVGELCPSVEGRVSSPVDIFINTSASGLHVGWSLLFRKLSCL